MTATGGTNVDLVMTDVQPLLSSEKLCDFVFNFVSPVRPLSYAHACVSRATSTIYSVAISNLPKE